MISIDDLSFQFKFQCDKEIQEVTEEFRELWSQDLISINWRGSGRSGETEFNWIEFKKNHFRYDTPKPGRDPSYYYPFIFTAYSKVKDINSEDVERQRSFASAVRNCLAEIGCTLESME